MKRRQSNRWQAAIWTATIVFTTFALAQSIPLRGQQPTEEQRSQFASMDHLSGEITAVAGATLTLKTDEDKIVQVVTTTNTRIMRGRGVAAKVADLKVGDGVVAVGNLDGTGGTLHAAMLFATDPEQMKAMRENLGKTYIAGKITAIDTDNAKITVERPDHVSQTIGLDESTSFRRGVRGAMSAPGASAAPGPSSESITLADIKVGDNVRGTGALKGGVFVPAQLLVVPAGAGQGVHHRPAGTVPPA